LALVSCGTPTPTLPLISFERRERSLVVKLTQAIAELIDHDEAERQQADGSWTGLQEGDHDWLRCGLRWQP
jgi:hypothetical protein